MLFFCGTLSSQDTSDPIPSFFEPSWIDFLNFIPSLKLVGRSIVGVKQVGGGGRGLWKWSNMFFEEYICVRVVCREKNDWSSCFGSLSISFFFFSSVGIFNLRNWFCLLFSGLHFRVLRRSRNFYWFRLFISIFFFFYFWMQIEFLSILFSLSPFFFVIAEFLQFYMFGGENWAFFQSFVAGFDGRIDFIAKRGMKWNSWELRPDGSRFLSHFWKEIRAE